MNYLKEFFSSKTGKIVFIFLIYFVIARVGLTFDAVSGFATLVWPPTGFALWTILTHGSSMWISIALGAFLVNLSVGAPILVALSIGAGNTLEALAGAYLLKQIINFKSTFERLKDALGFILLAAILSTTLSATIGVASLYLGNIVSLHKFNPTWWSWWVGDAMGNLIFGAFLLIWTQPLHIKKTSQRIEFVILILTYVFIGIILFGNHFIPKNIELIRLPYLLFPVLIWGALRFGPHGSITGTLILSLLAVGYAVSGHGPFKEGYLSERLLYLQLFMGIISVSTLILSSIITERNSVKEALQNSHDRLEIEVLKRTEELSLLNKELENDILKQKQAEELIKISLREKEILLKEINHRVKNNLQIIMSLLNLQSDYSNEPSTLGILKQVQSRIKTISYIHERLYQTSNLSKTDSREYIYNLCRYLLESYGLHPERVRLKTDIDDVSLEIETTIPCGLIINELLSNSLKHAFPNNIEGTIDVSLKVMEKEKQLKLSIKDSGIGLPQDMDFKKTKSLGLQLVNLLVTQLEGSIVLNAKGGTEFRIVFPMVRLK